MKGQRIGAWIAIIIGATYFIVPLLGTLEFSLRMRRDGYSFDAYKSVFSDVQFQQTFGYSLLVTRPPSSLTYEGNEVVAAEIAEDVSRSSLVAAWLKRNRLTTPARRFVDYAEKMLGEELGR